MFVMMKRCFVCGRNCVCKFNWDACVKTSAVSWWLLTAKVWVRFLAIPCKVCGGQKGTGNDCSAYASYFSCQYYSPVLHAHDLKTTIIRRTSGRRLDTFNQNNALPEIGKHWREKYFLTYFLHAWILYRQLEVGMHPEALATGQLEVFSVVCSGEKVELVTKFHLATNLMQLPYHLLQNSTPFLFTALQSNFRQNATLKIQSPYIRPICYPLSSTAYVRQSTAHQLILPSSQTFAVSVTYI